MDQFGFRKTIDVAPNSIEQEKKKKRRRFLWLLLLFILLAVPSCTMGLLIGKTNDGRIYAGRLIDSILVTPRKSAEKQTGEKNTAAPQNFVLELDSGRRIIKPDIKRETSQQTPIVSETSTDQKETEEPEEPIDPNDPENTSESGDSGESGGSSSKRSHIRKPDIKVSDDIFPGQIWTQGTLVDIFGERIGNNGVKTIDGIQVIAPGAKGRYIFKLENPETFDIEYTLFFSESDQNSPRLPMKYRLVAGVSENSYLGGNNWESMENISTGDIPLPAGFVHYYTLEWKWETLNDIIDTAIGRQSGQPFYLLNINVNAKAR
jgi:hypothetical protein